MDFISTHCWFSHKPVTGNKCGPGIFKDESLTRCKQTLVLQTEICTILNCLLRSLLFRCLNMLAQLRSETANKESIFNTCIEMECFQTIQELALAECRITFLWVRRRGNIPGNEGVDPLVEEGTNKNTKQVPSFHKKAYT